VFSIDKFMSEVRALTNIIGNGIAAVFVSWWEGELDHERLHANPTCANSGGGPRQINALAKKSPLHFCGGVEVRR
jgi:hypothetical protein